MLQKVVHDNTQTVSTNGNVIIVKVQIINDDSTNKMIIIPVKAQKGVIDTFEYFQDESVDLSVE